jgi:hypothetical protein
MAIAEGRGLAHRVEAGGGDDRGRMREQRRRRVHVEIRAAGPGHTHRVPGGGGQRRQRAHLAGGPGVDDERGSGGVVAGWRRGVDERERDHLRAGGSHGRQMVVVQRLDDERGLDPRQWPVQAARVPGPAQEAGDVVDGDAEVALELAEHAGGEGVDDEPLGSHAGHEIGDPAPQGGAVAVEGVGHADHREVADHARVDGEGRGGQERGAGGDAERLQDRARTHQVAQPTADRVVEDHGAARRSGVGSLARSDSRSSSA